MIKTIAILFSLEGQKFSKIRKELKRLKKHYESMKIEDSPVEVHVVNGHLPRNILKEINGGMEVRDTLDELFPNQMNFFDEETGKVNIEEMAEYVSDMSGKAYFIGEYSDEDYETFKSWIGKDNITVVAI